MIGSEQKIYGGLSTGRMIEQLYSIGVDGMLLVCTCPSAAALLAGPHCCCFFTPLICRSMIAFTAAVIFIGRPELGLLLKLPVSLYFCKNLVSLCGQFSTLPLTTSGSQVVACAIRALSLVKHRNDKSSPKNNSMPNCRLHNHFASTPWFLLP